MVENSIFKNNFEDNIILLGLSLNIKKLFNTSAIDKDFN